MSNVQELCCNVIFLAFKAFIPARLLHDDVQSSESKRSKNLQCYFSNFNICIQNFMQCTTNKVSACRKSAKEPFMKSTSWFFWITLMTIVSLQLEGKHCNFWASFDIFLAALISRFCRNLCVRQRNFYDVTLGNLVVEGGSN